MTRYVADPADARTFMCDAGVYEGWGRGDLIQLCDELVILVEEPARLDTSGWLLKVSRAIEIGKEAGTA